MCLKVLHNNLRFELTNTLTALSIYTYIMIDKPQPIKQNKMKFNGNFE